MKKAVVLLSYDDEAELNSFLSKNCAYVNLDAVYEDLDAADIECLEGFIQEDILSPEED